MKYFLLIITFSFYFLPVIAQEPTRVEFKKAKELPIGLFGMAYSTDSNRIYIFGGGSNNNPFTTSIYVYNSLLDEWTDLSRGTSLKPTRYGRAVYLPEFGSMILLGGTTPYGSSVVLAPDFELYDLNTYRAKVLCQNPLPSKLPGVAYWKDQIYIFGGSFSSQSKLSGKVELQATQKMFVYNPKNGVVQALTDLPEAKETDGGVIDGKLYTFGGFGNKPSNKIDVYDIEKNNWNEIGSFDNPVSAYALVSYGQYFILVGDYKNLNQMIVFDTKTYTWEVFEMNFKGRHMGAVVLNDVLHVFGGFSPKQKEAMQQHWTLDLMRFFDQRKP